MIGPNKAININQLKSFCVIFPDSCTFLNYILSEEEFKLKIDYFHKLVSQGIPSELLPKVNEEILKKLTDSVSDFMYTLKRCKFYCENIKHRPLGKTNVDKSLAEVLEQSFSKVFVELSTKRYPTPEKKNLSIRRARVVETSVIEEFDTVLEKNQTMTLKTFFDKIENRLRDKYMEFCDKQSLFMNELKTTSLTIPDILETEKSLDKTLIQFCNIHNKDDREVICQAIGRMYKLDKWCAVVTTDYSDIIRNRAAIDLKTQLIVSDPLYFAYKLEKKISKALHPKKNGPRTTVIWTKLIKQPPDIGVV